MKNESRRLFTTGTPISVRSSYRRSPTATHHSSADDPMKLTFRRAAAGPLVVAFLLWPVSRPVGAQYQLAPTEHPALPANPSDYWYVPAVSDRAAKTIAIYEPLVAGVARYE